MGLQPLVVGAWRTLCLFTASLMLVMIQLALDEVVAMIWFIAKERRKGKSAWWTFWLGGHRPDNTPHIEPAREPRRSLPSTSRSATVGALAERRVISRGSGILRTPAAHGLDSVTAAVLVRTLRSARSWTSPLNACDDSPKPRC